MLRNLRIFYFFLLLSASCPLSFAADNPGGSKTADQAQDSIPQLQEKIKNLEQELQQHKAAQELALYKVQTLKETLDSRMYDFANVTAMLGNNTAWVGNLIALFGSAITVLIFIAGFASYFSTKTRARIEAQEAARTWFAEKIPELEAQFRQRMEEKLLKNEQDVLRRFEELAHQVRAKAQALESEMEAAALREAEVLTRLAGGHEQEGAGIPDGQGQALHASNLHVLQASESLKSKPENEFTASEHYIRGASLCHHNNYRAALESFDAALKIAREAGSKSSELVKYQMARAYALGTLGEHDAAAAVYDELERHFALDPDDSVREQVAIGLLNKGISLGDNAAWDKALQAYEHLQARFGHDKAASVREQVGKGLYNSAYVLGKLGKYAEELAVYDQLEQRYAAQEVDLRQYRLPALRGLGRMHLLRAKSHWQSVGERRLALTQALRTFERALGYCLPVENCHTSADLLLRAKVMLQIGYCLFLGEEHKSGADHCREGLQLGGAEAMEWLREFIKQDYLQVEDAQFLAAVAGGQVNAPGNAPGNA